jgi:hypothetical protein
MRVERKQITKQQQEKEENTRYQTQKQQHSWIKKEV